MEAETQLATVHHRTAQNSEAEQKLRRTGPGWLRVDRTKAVVHAAKENDALLVSNVRGRWTRNNPWYAKSDLLTRRAVLFTSTNDEGEER
ncbi:uncharacterized protein CTRU02_213496 [Colletotrichum truncatum]|uniref:Uncharacterized protein n=1 Tax=Colletotrichum truncatum TaxID=5467 RepID=A0ACC3YFZ8_COLTU